MIAGMRGLTTALAILCSAAPAAGQGVRPADGMVLDSGEWRNPTVEEALHALTLERHAWPLLRDQQVHRPIVAILRRGLQSGPAADLDGLADALADMMLADRSPEGRIRRNAAAALKAAASPGPDYAGTPHRKSFDALVRVYETRATQVLTAGGGDDPFLVARGSQREFLSLGLSDILWADREGLGRDYVLGVHLRSDPPPEHCGRSRRELPPGDEYSLPRCRRDSTWCVAGHFLYWKIVQDAREEDARRRGFTLWEVTNGQIPPLPPGIEEAAARWFRLCRGGAR